MKNILSYLLLLLACNVSAQNQLVPGDKEIDVKLIKDETYTMSWCTVRDTIKFEIAKVITTVNTNVDKLNIYTDVQIRNSKTKWSDTTVVALPSLKPLYHSSYNLEREIVVNYGTTITGHHELKASKKRTAINENIKSGFFDSSFYPYLIRLLPLKEGYTKDIAIYDYNPAKNSLLTASVKSVKSAIYKSKKGKKTDVWEVVVTDETGNGVMNVVTHYIGKADRKLYKMAFKNSGQNMIMERLE